MKRIFDILVSFSVLLLSAPLLLLLALLIRKKLGSPVLFSQPRPGLKGKSFRMVKFRSMTDERDDAGELLSDAERLTRFGKILRATSLDELPELWNVLKGEMSIVGPRPLMMEYLPFYSTEQARRHDMLPGVTGLAQISGRNALTWEKKFELDVWYIDNYSFWLDIKILLATVKKVLIPEGVSPNGHATMPKFTGSKEDKDV
ncbi:MAG: sugar transferase [Colwellia sp.]